MLQFDFNMFKYTMRAFYYKIVFFYKCQFLSFPEVTKLD